MAGKDKKDNGDYHFNRSTYTFLTFLDIYAGPDSVKYIKAQMPADIFIISNDQQRYATEASVVEILLEEYRSQYRELGRRHTKLANEIEEEVRTKHYPKRHKPGVTYNDLVEGRQNTNRELGKIRRQMKLCERRISALMRVSNAIYSHSNSYKYGEYEPILHADIEDRIESVAERFQRTFGSLIPVTTGEIDNSNNEPIRSSYSFTEFVLWFQKLISEELNPKRLQENLMHEAAMYEMHKDVRRGLGSIGSLNKFMEIDEQEFIRCEQFIRRLVEGGIPELASINYAAEDSVRKLARLPMALANNVSHAWWLDTAYNAKNRLLLNVPGERRIVGRIRNLLEKDHIIRELEKHNLGGLAMLYGKGAPHEANDLTDQVEDAQAQEVSPPKAKGRSS